MEARLRNLEEQVASLHAKIDLIIQLLSTASLSSKSIEIPPNSDVFEAKLESHSHTSTPVPQSPRAIPAPLSPRPSNQDEPHTPSISIRKLALLGSMDGGKSSLLQQILAHRRPPSIDFLRSASSLFVRHFVSATTLLLHLESAAKQILTSIHLASVPTFEIDTPALRIRFHGWKELHLMSLPSSPSDERAYSATETRALPAISWLRSESYPDMVASLAADQVLALTALWNLPAWQQLLNEWPRVLHQLWPLYLYIQAREKKLSASAIASAQPGPEASSSSASNSLDALVGNCALTSLFQPLFNSRQSWALLSSASYFRDVMLPRLSLHHDSTDNFVLQSIDLLRLHDSTRGLRQENIQASAFNLCHEPEAASRWVGSLLLDKNPSSSELAQQSLKVLDVGGSRNQLKNWKHVVPDPEVDAVVFALSLLDYSLPASGDPSVSRLHESLSLFERTFGPSSSSPLHRPNLKLVVMLTHADLLLHRHSQIPLHRMLPPYVQLDTFEIQTLERASQADWATHDRDGGNSWYDFQFDLECTLFTSFWRTIVDVYGRWLRQRAGEMTVEIRLCGFHSSPHR